MAKILLHTFGTRGYLPWIELLLASTEFQSGTAIDIRVDGMNLTDEDVESLASRHPRVVISNTNVAMEEISRILSTDVNELRAWKSQVESARTTDKNFWYKIFISVSKRYRSMDRVIDQARRDGYQLLIHADADLYVRTDLVSSALVAEALQHDVSLFVNNSLTSLLHIRKVLGAFLCFNLDRCLDPFVARWMAEIDSVPFARRWKGFGQSVLWYAMNASEDTDIYDLNRLAPGFRYSRFFDQEAHMWFGSNSKLRLFKLQKKLGIHALKGRADASRSRCWRDLNRRFERGGHARASVK